MKENYKSVILNYKNFDVVISKRIEDFSKINQKEQIFYELCFCLLTPQSNAKRCDQAITLLKEQNLYIKNLKIDAIREILKTRTRFHNNKGKYVYDLKGIFENLWNQFDLINKQGNPYEIREWLIKNIKGLGLKEASHFLRNIGFRNIAILDRHILKNLAKLNVIPEVPKGLTKNKYLLIEKNFNEFSKQIGIHMDKLDLYFWCAETGEVFK